MRGEFREVLNTHNYNARGLRWDRRMRKLGYRVRLFARVVPDVLALLALVGLVLGVVRIFGALR